MKTKTKFQAINKEKIEFLLENIDFLLHQKQSKAPTKAEKKALTSCYFDIMMEIKLLP